MLEYNKIWIVSGKSKIRHNFRKLTYRLNVDTKYDTMYNIDRRN
jgi:hypothetical protein